MAYFYMFIVRINHCMGKLSMLEHDLVQLEIDDLIIS